MQIYIIPRPRVEGFATPDDAHSLATFCWLLTKLFFRFILSSAARANMHALRPATGGIMMNGKQLSGTSIITRVAN